MAERLEGSDFYKKVEEGGDIEPLLDEKQITEALVTVENDDVLAGDQLTIDVISSGGTFVGTDGQPRCITNLDEFLNFRRKEIEIQREIEGRNPNAAAARDIEEAFRRGPTVH